MENRTSERIRGVIDEVAILKRRQLEVERERRELSERIEVLRARALMQVASTRDESGRLLYSNEQLRRAALVLYLGEDEAYNGLRHSLWRLDDEARANAIELERLADLRLLLLAEVGVTGAMAAPVPGVRAAAP